MGLDGTELAVATAHLKVPARGAATLDVPAHVREASDASAEVLVADAGYPGDDDHVRGLWTFAEDKDLAYESAPFTAQAQAKDGGYTVTVKAHALVRDLTVLADKVAPDAETNDALVTLLAGESHTFKVSTRAVVDADRFTERGVLVSVNAIG